MAPYSSGMLGTYCSCLINIITFDFTYMIAIFLNIELITVNFLNFRADKEVGAIEQAHDSIVWTLAWHPLGHILCSGSNDHTSKFWTRNRPGDLMRDKYNLNTLPAGSAGIDDHEIGTEYFLKLFQ